jgi:VRR-NUC domain
VSELALRERERLGELEAVIERGVQTFVEVGEALMEIRDSRLYKQTHSSFESYLRQRWNISRPRGYQLIDAAKLSTTVDTPVENERRARALKLATALPESETDDWETRDDPPALPVSEDDFQKAVTDALTLFGWRWVHFRPARTLRGWRTALSGSPGYPDLTAVRGDRVIFIELKAQRGELRDEQREWFSALGATGCVEVHCWRPSDWAEIEELIR